MFKDFINEPLRVDDEGCEVLRELAKDVFGYEFHETNRSIEARIRDCKDILLVDKMTFLHINKINVSSDLLSEVKKILINELKIRDGENRIRSVYGCPKTTVHGTSWKMAFTWDGKCSRLLPVC